MVLRVGQRVPDFALPDHMKQERKLSEFIQKGNVVLPSFPSRSPEPATRRCACSGTACRSSTRCRRHVVGISVDSVFTLKVFAQTYNLEFPF